MQTLVSDSHFAFNTYTHCTLFSMSRSLFLLVLILQVLFLMCQAFISPLSECDETLRTKAIKDIRAAELNLGTCRATLNTAERNLEKCKAIFNAADVENIGVFDQNVIFAGTSLLNWTESKSFCRCFSASLAVIENEILNDDIKNKLMKYKNPYGLGELEGFWIGGQRFNDTLWIWDKDDSQEPILWFGLGPV